MPLGYLYAGSYTLTHYHFASSSTTVGFGVVASDYQTTPSSTLTATTSWRRTTNSITISSNGFFSLYYIRVADATPVTWIDGVMLETGTVASAYSTMSQVEFGLSTTNINHVLNKETVNYVQLRSWNNGAIVGATNVTQFFDYANTNFHSYTFTTNALPAGASTVNLALPAGRSGWVRGMSYQTNVNGSQSEMPAFVRPYQVTKSRDTNGLLGTHPNAGDYSVQSAREAGYTYGRDLSPAQIIRWSIIQTNGSGPFYWNNYPPYQDYFASFFSTNGLVPFVIPTPGCDPVTLQCDGYWPRDATNGNPVQADIGAWTNYIGNAVSRVMGNPTNVMYVSTGNEFHNIVTPTDMTNPSNNAAFQGAAALTIRMVCTNCIVVGLSGMNDPDFAWSVWTNLTAAQQAAIDVIDTHLYPINQGAANPNLSSDDISANQSALKFKQKFASVNKPIWNTEMGSQGNKGGMLGLIGMASPLYPTYATLVPEAGRDWGMGQRKIVAVDRETTRVLQCLGMGFSKVFMYTQEDVDTDIWVPNYISISTEFSGTPRQGPSASLIAANYFARNPGLGRVTNVNTLSVEAYYFTNALGTVVALWCSDQQERTITLTSNQFALYDVGANLLCTNQASIRIGRTPRYIVSGGMTTAILKTNVELASLANVTDQSGPNISIDVTPIGPIVAGTNVFKWTLTDFNKQAWSIGSYSPDNTNNRSRIKFRLADSWIDVGESNHFIAYFAPTSTFNLFVEGKDFYNNTNVAVGPAFGDFTAAAVLTTNIIFSITNPLPLTQMVQVVRFTYATNLYTAANTALFDSSGNFEPYQQGSSNQIFFRAGLLPNSTQSWTFVSGVAPTNISGLRGYIGLSTNASASIPWQYQVTNGLHTGFRTVNPIVAGFSNAAPWQGVQLRNGFWVNGESGTNGTNIHYVSKDEVSVAPVPVCWSNMTVTVIDAGPIRTEILFSGTYRRSEFNYLGSIQQWPASPGFYRFRLAMDAQEPSVQSEPFSNDSGYFRFDVSPGMAANQFRYRGHSSSSLVNGYLWGDTSEFPTGPYSFDILCDVTPGTTNLASFQQNEFGNIAGIAASSYNFPLFIRDAGIWNLMWLTNGAATLPTIGWANIRQSVGLGGVVSALSPRLGYWSTNNGRWGIEFGSQVYADTTTPMAVQMSRARWLVYFGTNGSIINSSNAGGYIQPEIMPLWARHYALDIDKIKSWNLGWTESLAPGGFYMDKASVLTNYATPIKGGDVALYNELKAVSGNEGDLILNLWRTNSSTAAAATLSELIYTASQTFNLFTNWLTANANQANEYNSLQGIAQTLVRAAPVLDAILGDGNATATVSNQTKAWIAMNGNMVRDNDVTPIGNYVSNVVNLGTANMPAQYAAAWAAYSIGFTNHPVFGTNAFADYLSSSNTLTDIINDYGASIGSPHYAGASVQPIFGNLLQARVRGWTNSLYGRLQSHADWNIQNSTPIDPRFGQSELVVFGEGYPSGNGMNGMLAGAFYAGIDDTRASRLLYRWAQEDKPSSDYFFPSFLMIPRDFAQTAYTLVSEQTPGYWSVHRDRADSTNHSAFWMINGSYYSDHRISPDTANYNWFPLGVPASVGWGSIYYPQVDSQLFGNIWTDFTAFPSWAGSNVYTEALTWPEPQGETTNFLYFTRSTWSDAYYTNAAGSANWGRKARTFGFFRNASLLELTDVKNNANNYIWTAFFMSTGVIVNPGGSTTPVFITNDVSGTINMPLVTTLSGPVDIPMSAGTNSFKFTGVPWVAAPSNGLDFLLTTHSPTTNQVTFSTWSHSFADTATLADYLAVNSATRYFEQQQIPRIKGTNNVHALMMAYRKLTVEPTITTNTAGDFVAIQGQEVQIVNTNYSEFSEGSTNRAFVNWTSNPLTFTNGITQSGGPTEVMVGQTNYITAAGASGRRIVTMPANWRSPAPRLFSGGMGVNFTSNRPVTIVIK